MDEPYEATDSPSPEPAAPKARKEKEKKEKEREEEKEEKEAREKEYRLYNTSGQTVYVVNSEGTHCLPPREFYDLPFSKISYHVKLMVRRGFLSLFEKEET